jgi:integrase
LPSTKPGEITPDLLSVKRCHLCGDHVQQFQPRFRGLFRIGVVRELNPRLSRSRIDRDEILALRWADIDVDAATVRIERSLEQTKAGLRFKAPKTKHGRRVIALPPIAVRKLELRIALGQGKPELYVLAFSTIEGDLIPPNNLRDWASL